MKYTINSIDDMSIATDKRIAIKIIVGTDSLPSQEETQKAINHVHKLYHTKNTEVTVFAYTYTMDTKWNAFAVAEYDKKGELLIFNWVPEAVKINTV